MIAGQLEPEKGRITLQRGTRLGWLAQHGLVHAGRTLRDECRSVVQTAEWAEARLAELAAALAENPEDPQREEDYASLLSRMEAGDFARADADIGRVLDGLGFSPADQERDCSEFSGGWQMRIALARVLLSAADLLLLDEPTNYLDIDARQWLERRLATRPGASVFVAHDRAFMERVSTHTARLLGGEIRLFPGTLSRLEQQLSAEEVELRKAWQAQQERISQLEDFIRRFRAKSAKARQVQDRVRELESMERIELPSHLRRVALRLPELPFNAGEVMRTEALCRSYGSREVIRNLDLELPRGERLAVIGRNGSGKSTLLRIIAGTDQPSSGQVAFGANVRRAVYAQDAAEHLPPRESILEHLATAAPGRTETELRTFLGAFLFHGDDVHKPCRVLSGGERARVALASAILQPANLLVLDEPANHLDLDSQDVLLGALQQYGGTIVFVSHDEDFVRRLATRILEMSWELGKDGTSYRQRLIHGDLSYYEYRREQEATGSPGSPGSTGSSAVPEITTEAGGEGAGARPHAADGTGNADTARSHQALSRQERKDLQGELRRLERRSSALLEEISELEIEVELLEQRLADSAVYQDGEMAAAVARDLSELHRKLDLAQISWEETEEQVAVIQQKLGGEN